MQRLKFCSVATLALLVTTSANSETLAGAIALAYRSNPTLQSTRYEVRAADEGVVQARSELRPSADFQVSGGYDYTREGRRTSDLNPFTPDRSGQNADQGSLSISQPLYTSGRATADRASAEASVRSAREALRASEGDLLLAVVTAYVDIRRYAASVAVLSASAGELEKIEAEIVARQQAGELTRTDIAQAEGQIALAREQATDAEQALESARADYTALVGRNPGDLAAEPPLPQLPRDVDTAFTLAERRSPELARACFTEEASRETIAATRASGGPVIALRGAATANGRALPFRTYDQDVGLSGSVVLTLPLSAGGRIASQVREAEDRNSSDRLRIEAERRDLIRTVSTAWNQVVTAGRATALIERRRRAAATQLDGMVNEYRLGLRSTFDVLYAQQTLRDAEVALLAARRDRYVSEATLLRRTGLLEADALMTGIDLYDPTRNFRAVANRNAVPWEPAVSALDKVAAAQPRTKALEQPGATAHPAVIPAANGVPADADLVRTVPVAPILGTVGRPASTPRKFN